ncbi:BTB/POZ protein [Geranomyces variabilis]|nr:BTB/POZ protein [Geranomyces variabilis]KAJ3136067.1 hypothetical protein HDU90_003470 [Geranomyces variabilis]
MPPIVSKNHVYDDADVRIVVGNTAFLVHTLVLKLKSDYFEACFRGPWTENTVVVDGRKLRQVTLNDVDPKEFSQLLDWMYRPELCFDPVKAFPLVKIADRFQVVSLFNYLDQLKPPTLTWKNIEEWLETATTGPRRFEKCVECCTNFLLKPKRGLYVRALYLAEKYNLARIEQAKVRQAAGSSIHPAFTENLMRTAQEHVLADVPVTSTRSVRAPELSVYALQPRRTGMSHDPAPVAASTN